MSAILRGICMGAMRNHDPIATKINQYDSSFDKTNANTVKNTQPFTTKALLIILAKLSGILLYRVTPQI